MKKFICIMLTFVMAAALFACTKEAEKPDATSTRVADTQHSAENNSEVQTVISGIDIDPETNHQLCSVPTVNRNEGQTKPVLPEGATESTNIPWPNVPVSGIDKFQAAAFEEMGKNPKFSGAKVKKDQYLQLGEIGGEPCVRVHFDTDKGEFIAIINEDCDVLDTWSDSEEKTMQYWFPQMWDINIASDENLCIAFHAFHGDEHYKNGIILDYRQVMADFTDGSTTCKVTFITTSGDFTVLIDQYGRIVSRTK